MQHEPNQKIFATGLMRTGGSLVMNILSLTANTHLFNERLNFFRFIYGHYNLSFPHQVELALEEFRIRLKYRSGINFDSKAVAKSILERKASNAVFYDEVYKYFLKQVGKVNWGEYANLSWRYIPHFLQMYPNGKVIVVVRDPRAIIASFKRLTFLPGNAYLNIIFNWIDFINHMNKYLEVYPKSKLHVVKLEDLHKQPETFVPKLVSFVGEEFKEIMLQPEKWAERLDERFDKVNLSAYTKQKVYGFDPTRNDTWIEKLDQLDIELIELVAGEHIEKTGYPLTINKQVLRRKSVKLIKVFDHPILTKNYELFSATGAGTDDLPSDPRLPENWSSPEDPFKKFSETNKFHEFCDEIKLVKSKLQEKYF